MTPKDQKDVADADWEIDQLPLGEAAIDAWAGVLVDLAQAEETQQ